MERQYNVVIVGAGVAGLSAARLLGRFGLSCCVLEAAPLIGGRLRTLRRPGWELPIELGAEFVHGRPGGEEAARTLATPWEDTVFFAGEALDLQYPSTVAGALGSGEHTARRLLESRSRNR